MPLYTPLRPLVSATAANTSGQSIPNNTNTVITGWTKIFDTNSAFSTSGVYTVPFTGKYLATLSASFGSTFTANTGRMLVFIQQAGSASKVAASGAQFAQNSDQVAAEVTFLFNCVAGDTLTLNVSQDNGTARPLFSSDSNWNNFSVALLGN